MVEKKIRFPDDVWRAIELNAAREGMSAAELVRIGALSYAAFLTARRGDEATAGFERLWAAAKDLVGVWPL